MPTIPPLRTSPTAVILAAVALLHAANPAASATNSQGNQGAPRPNVLIIGASSLNAPVPQAQLLGAMLESKGLSMIVEGQWPKLDALGQMLRSQKAWDYVVMDAWHLGRGRNQFGSSDVPKEFPQALAAFVKEVRAHSPKCKIILFSWWIPGGPKATNEGAMEVFQRCVAEAKQHQIWVATTGPAFMEAQLDRANLRIVTSKTDAHPGIHGAYLNACSLFAIITDQTPVGLPATLQLLTPGGKKTEYTILQEDAKDLQERAWKVYQRESKVVKPAK